MRGNQVNAPRSANIAGQPHQLSYITPREAQILKMLGGAGQPVGKQQIPAYWSWTKPSSWFDGKGYTGSNNTIKSGSGTVPHAAGETAPNSTWDAHNEFMNNKSGGGGKKGGSSSSSSSSSGGNSSSNNNNVFDLSDINTGLTDFSSQVGGSDMYSYLDNPNTAENESLAGTVGAGLSGYVDTLSGLDTSGYSNAAEIEAALASATGLQDTISGYETDLSGAIDATTAAMNDYTKGLMGDTYGIDNYGIQDIDAVNALNEDLYMSNLDYQFDPNIDSTIADTLGLNTTYNDLYNTATGTLSGIGNQYDTALSDLNANIEGLINTGSIGFGGSGAASNALTNAIAQGENFANQSGFSSSQLDNIMANNNFLGNISTAQNNIASAQAAEAAEAQRVSNFLSGQTTAANNLIGQIGNSGYYSKANLDALQASIDAGRSGYAGFSSPYGFDPSGLNSLYGSAQTNLDELRGTRTRNLDAAEAGIQNYMDGFADINLWEEGKFNDALSGLRDSEYNLSQYTGGDRLAGIYDSLDTNRGLVQGKLQELSDYRGGIETDAQSLYDNLLASNYNRDTNTQFRDQLNPLLSDMTKYNATQAGDETQAIENELARRLGLIEQDEANVAARLAASNADLGNYQFGSRSLVDPFENQGNPYLYSNEEEEELINNYGSAFSNNVIRV